MTASIIEQHPAEDGKPSVTIRSAGDRAMLVEYGEMVFDLSLNFFALAVHDALQHDPPAGFVESAPGFRAVLVRYDSHELPPGAMVEHLRHLHRDVKPEALTVPSRIVHLPIAFDEATSLAAIERYIRTIRKDAPNCEGGNNIDYIVRYNGLSDREELYDAVLATEQWNGFIGFFPGLPFMFPLDPRHAVTAPKFNPTRTWTAEGAVGIGGPCWAIYPVESAGGYQLVGRTIPIYDLQERNSAFRDNPLLMRVGDRVQFHRVSEEELEHTWGDVRADRYTYEIVDSPFDVAAFLHWRETIKDEAEERARHRAEAAASTPLP